MKKLVAFDLDGTLNKTDLYAVLAHQKAQAEFGATVKSSDDIIATFGERGEDIVHTLIDSNDVELGKAYLRRVGECEREFIADHHGEYDGITEMLKKLKADGYLTAICSNSSERYITMVLEHLNLLQYIDYIQPLIKGLCKVETLGLLIERVKPDKAVMVGDRRFDMEAAVGNSIPFIGCLYGFGGVKAFEVEAADIAVNTPCEINAAVDKLMK